MGRTILEQLCERGQPAACHVLAGMVAAGEGGVRQPARARRLDAQACEAGYAPACGAVAPR